MLKAVARRCREVLRDADLFARFGGEEFIGLLITSSEEEVALIAERLRAAIAGEAIAVGAMNIQVSVSVGTAAGPAALAGEACTAEVLIARADAALYLAKQGGRNQVVMAEA